MCVPVATLMLAATAVSAIGTGVGALSAASQARYQARVADANAKAESARAVDAINRGDLERRSYQRKLGQEMGSQNAALAANGIDITFGSAADMRADTAMFGEEDSQTITENSRREAMGLDINAVNYLAEAKSQRRQAGAALIGGAFGVANTVLGGATQFKKYQAERDEVRTRPR